LKTSVESTVIVISSSPSACDLPCRWRDADGGCHASEGSAELAPVVGNPIDITSRFARPFSIK
jgi:hypothetical protein